MKNKEELTEMLSKAKEIIKKDGEHAPIFVVESSGKRILLNSLDENGDLNRKVVKKGLKLIIERENAEKYFAVFSAWMIDGKSREQRVKKELNHLQDNPSRSKLMGFLKKMAELSDVPSESSDRKEIIVASRFHKTKGMDSVYCEVRRFADVIEFGEVKSFNGTISSQWNIWYRHQIDLNELAGGEE